MLNPREIDEIEETYRENEPRYRRLMECVIQRCDSFRKRNPKIARIIFSREPELKSLESITRKIEDRRAEKGSQGNGYTYSDLTDIVALSILCPFDSDIPEVTQFLRTTFDVAEENDEAAYRDYSTGHRAYHFTVSLSTEDLTGAYSDLEDLKCEIQVKTILAEAFDAKSHDLAYKPGQFDVGEELKKQFSFLSSILRAIDGQSEFLKDLIVKEQKELDLRRKALLGRYLSQVETTEAGLKIGIDLKASPKPDLVTILKKIRQLRRHDPISPEICKFSALCALEFGNEALKRLALQLADRLVASATVSDSPRHHLLRGYVYWVLGEYVKALRYTRTVIQAGRTSDDSIDYVKRAKNNFIYFVCDWNLFKNMNKPDLLKEMNQYVEEIKSDGELRENESDTIGLVKILFGGFADIDEGRQLLRNAKNTIQDPDRAQTYLLFFNLHEYVALSRQVELARFVLDQSV